MSFKIRKAIFPVAGLGSRFLPATKANPKEMLPIVDKPLIQYAVEEAIAAGITDLIFVTSSSKRAIEDHFDSNYELEHKLKEAGKYDLLKIVQNILPKHVNAVYVRQAEALGLGHAILCAKNVINNEPFAILLADDLIDANPCCLTQLINVYNKTRGNVLAVQEIAKECSQQYGIVDIKKENELYKIKSIIEKPSPKDAPSNFAVIGRYILSAKIFPILENTARGAGNEIQLTDAIYQLLKNENAYAVAFTGVRYDCGSKLGFVQATVNYALQHQECAKDFREFLRHLDLRK